MRIFDLHSRVRDINQVGEIDAIHAKVPGALLNGGGVVDIPWIEALKGKLLHLDHPRDHYRASHVIVAEIHIVFRFHAVGRWSCGGICCGGICYAIISAYARVGVECAVGQGLNVRGVER